jgi:hypothetical protein
LQSLPGAGASHRVTGPLGEKGTGRRAAVLSRSCHGESFTCFEIIFNYFRDYIFFLRGL